MLQELMSTILALTITASPIPIYAPLAEVELPATEIEVEAVEEEPTIREQLTEAYPEVDEAIIDAVLTQAENYEVDVWLAMAVAEQESNFDPTAISAGGDHGLMQINKCNHKWLGAELGITDWLDAEQNAKAGCYILSAYQKKGYTTTQTLMAYNMGENGAKKAWANGKTESTYSREVQERIKK